MSDLKPYRIEARFTTAADSVEGASELLDQLTKRAEAIGINLETAGVEPMEEADVIAGSPLARRLEGGKG